MQTESQTSSSVTLDVYVDFVCPWCYLAHGVVEKLREKYDLTIHWLPFPLHPETPPEGLLLSELFKGADIDSMHERLYLMMDELQLIHCERDKIFNTRSAQELAAWAAGKPQGETLIAQLFQAYFAGNQNLADTEVLLNIVEKSGLDRQQAAQVLTDGSMSSQVEKHWQNAAQLQIQGVPAFIYGGYSLSGFRPLEQMEQFIEAVQQAPQ